MENDLSPHAGLNSWYISAKGNRDNKSYSIDNKRQISKLAM